jgi:chromosome segregation ATPase
MRLERENEELQTENEELQRENEELKDSIKFWLKSPEHNAMDIVVLKKQQIASNTQQIASNTQQIASNKQQIASNKQQIIEELKKANRYRGMWDARCLLCESCFQNCKD